MPPENWVEPSGPPARFADYKPGAVEYSAAIAPALAIFLFAVLEIIRHRQRVAIRPTLGEGDDLKPGEADASSWWWSAWTITNESDSKAL
ncbi:MAG: hypothetical protein DPW14_03075 [Planctomycetes bacterium]|nr:hypothetical protein [Planctomycetota bacterium]